MCHLLTGKSSDGSRGGYRRRYLLGRKDEPPRSVDTFQHPVDIGTRQLAYHHYLIERHLDE
jgi:hypothetical protein